MIKEYTVTSLSPRLRINGELPNGHLDPLEQYLREISQIERISPQDEIRLAKLIKKGNKTARKQMIEANLRLVVKIAKRYSKNGLPFLDLISEGNIGLMEAVKRFKPGKGAKLSTYASIWIKQTIRRGLANQSRNVRLPVHLVDKIFHMHGVINRLHHEFGRAPTDDEVADVLGITLEKVQKMKIADMLPVSIDSPVEFDSSITFADCIPDERVVSPSEGSSTQSDSDRLHMFISQLPERDREILSLRFGLNDGGEGLTLKEVGKKFGITRERARQIQNALLRLLRARMNGTAHRKLGRKMKKH